MDSNITDAPGFHSDFYRNGLKKILIWIVLEVLVILGLLLAIVYFIFFQPPSSYYITTTNGITLPLVSDGKVSVAGS